MKIRVKPAIISTMENYQLYNEYVVLVGWGLTNESPDRPTRYLQQVKIKVLPHTVCLNIMYDLFKKSVSLPDRYLCTKGEPHVFTAAVSQCLSLIYLSLEGFYNTLFPLG